MWLIICAAESNKECLKIFLKGKSKQWCFVNWFKIIVEAEGKLSCSREAAAAGSGELGTGTTTQSPWVFSPRFYLLSLNDKPFRLHLVIFHICIITISHICDIDYSRPLLSGTISRPYHHAGTNIKHRQSSVDFLQSHQWKQYGLLLLWKTSSGSKTRPTQIQPYLPRHQLPLHQNSFL